MKEADNFGTAPHQRDDDDAWPTNAAATVAGGPGGRADGRAGGRANEGSVVEAPNHVTLAREGNDTVHCRRGGGRISENDATAERSRAHAQ